MAVPAEPLEPRLADPDSALAFLAEASAVLAASLDLETTLGNVLTIAVPRLADWCALELVQPDGSLRPVSRGAQDDLFNEVRRRFRAAEGKQGGVDQVLRTGRPEVMADTASATPRTWPDITPEEQRLVERLATVSYMLVPLLRGTRVVGVLTLISTTLGRHYGPGDLAVAEDLAQRCAVAVENARLHGEAERSLALLDTLFGQAPIGLAFFDKALRFVRLNERLAEIDGLPVEAHVGRTVPEVLPNMDPDMVAALRRVLATGEPLVDAEFAGETPAAPGELRRWLASYYPVRLESGRVLGLGAVINEVTEARRAEAEREAATRRSHFLAEASAILDSSLDYETTLANIAGVAVPTVADWCAILVAEADGSVRQLAVAHADRARERLAWELAEKYPADPGAPFGPPAVIRSGQTEVLDEITDALLVQAAQDEDHLRIIRGLGLTASITAPLSARGRTYGALLLVLSDESGRRFGPEDVTLVEDLARRAGLAADNARLYTERTRIARTLQAGLLPPSLPTIPGVQIAARYRAAGELNDVGGDFYDVFPLGGGEWIALIGDVSGKGAPAAAVTALARYTLRAAGVAGEEAPRMLGLLNEAMLTQLEGREFCTVALCQLSVHGAALDVTVVLGGHLPPLLLRSDGDVERVGVPGTLIGVEPALQVEAVDIRLSSGDTLLLYTDGVPEARRAGGRLGEEGLALLLRGAAAEPLEVVVERIAQAATPAEDVRLPDDIALLALRV